MLFYVSQSGTDTDESNISKTKCLCCRLCVCRTACCVQHTKPSGRPCSNPLRPNMHLHCGFPPANLVAYNLENTFSFVPASSHHSVSLCIFISISDFSVWPKTELEKSWDVMQWNEIILILLSILGSNSSTCHWGLGVCNSFLLHHCPSLSLSAFF